MVPVFLGTTVLMFALLRSLPGDPVYNRLDPQKGYTPETVAAIRAEMGLDRPIPVQYVLWLGASLQGDLGFSFFSFRPVADLLQERAWPTFILMGSALVAALVVSIPSGIISAIRQHSLADYITSVGVMLAISVPSFFTGLLAIYIFAVKLQLFPFGGMHTAGQPTDAIDLLHHLILPASILGLIMAGPIARYTRSSMLEILNSDYLISARAKGLREGAVIMFHAMPNALIPIVAVIGIRIPSLIAGSVVIENIFSWPGMGQLMVTAFEYRDYPVLMGILGVVASVVLATSLLTDILYAVIDPRIRFS